jgi:large subunit ribosomal protein L17
MRPFTEKLITLGKKGDLSSRRRIMSLLKGSTQGDEIADKLIKVIGDRYKERNGGYTRIVRAGFRQGDNSEMAYVELV